MAPVTAAQLKMALFNSGLAARALGTVQAVLQVVAKAFTVEYALVVVVFVPATRHTVATLNWYSVHANRLFSVNEAVLEVTVVHTVADAAFHCMR